jgi:hypothetical protein
MERIGGEQERGEVERELEMLRRKVRKAKVMRERLEAVKEELGRVWVDGRELPPPEGEMGVESLGTEDEEAGRSGMAESYAEVAAAELGEVTGEVAAEAAGETVGEAPVGLRKRLHTTKAMPSRRKPRRRW